MKGIRNINDKGLYHGYQERYWSDGKLWYKGYYNNGMFADYEEVYNNDGKLIRKRFFIWKVL
jgi:antitoxin component YwqK of YwqJK toxin-antitoxin module